MLRTNERTTSTTSMINFFNTPAATDPTSSWLDTLANSVGWFNPFQSGLQIRLPKILITSLLLLEALGIAQSQANVVQDLACFKNSVDPDGNKYLILECKHPFTNHNFTTTDIFDPHDIAFFCGKTILPDTYCHLLWFENRHLPTIVKYTRDDENGHLLETCELKSEEGDGDGCLKKHLHDHFLPPETPHDQKPSADYSRLMVAGSIISGVLYFGLSISTAWCFFRKPTKSAGSPKLEPDLPHEARYVAVCNRLEALENVNDDRITELLKAVKEFKDTYQDGTTLDIMSHPVTLSCRHNADKNSLTLAANKACGECCAEFGEDDVKVNPMIQGAITAKLTYFEKQLDQIEKDKPQALNRIVIL